MKCKTLNVNIHMLSFCLLLLALGIIFLSGLALQNANTCMQKQLAIEQNRRQCAEQSQALANASDYLTSAVWHFIATQQVSYLQDYWHEVDILQSRDKALEQLAALSLTPREEQLLHAAKEESDKLIGREAWAMRLTAESMGLQPQDMPPKVAAVQFQQGEETLSPEAKQGTALAYIFGKQYQDSKALIHQNIEAFRTLLSERKNDELRQASQETRAALHLTQGYNIAVLGLLLLSFLLFYALVMRPFHRYAVSLQDLSAHEFVSLQPVGSKETKAFAKAFNLIHQDWEKQKKQLEQERFRFRVAVENTSVVVFEYDLATDVYTAYGNLYPDQKRDASIPMERVIPAFMQSHITELVEEGSSHLVSHVLSGQSPGEIELRVRVYQSKQPFLWARVTTTPIVDAQQVVTKIIGKITNIESEKAKEFALEEMKSRDSLTGLYNKETGIRLVQEYMKQKSPQEICGIMLLDMDNFTQLNQEEGSVFADAVLQEVADILRAQTGSEDILVRLGGDEFMLFIKGCPKSRATILGPQIATLIRNLSLRQEAGLQISASIGMCVTEVVDEYSGLYRCAESTLKYVKEHGKGAAACYLDTSNDLGTMLTQVYPEKHFINDIDRPGDHQEVDLIAFALELLGKSNNLDDAIFLLLARIGRSCHMDRVSILEMNIDYLTCKFPYQWAQNASELQMGQTYYVTQEEWQSIPLAYDQDGLCDKYLIQSLTTPYSCLHAGIWNQGVYVGGVCLEIWKKEYTWPLEQRKLLGELVKIIASFILKARADALSQAKTDFLSRMSHEIRTPMNAITGMTAIAKSVLPDQEKTMDCLHKIEAANAYLLSLINDILDMSRIESGKVELNLETIAVEEQLRALEALMRPQAEAKQIDFGVQKAFAGGLKVLADPLRLNQVLINIISNAIKFTPAGGKVLVMVKQSGQTEETVKLRFSVQDTGIGIAKEALGRIFNVFEQAEKNTANTFGGTGLGLSISSRLVQMMGGTLEVTSEVDQGACFYFTLPLPRAFPCPQEESGAKALAPAPTYRFLGKRILVAEDNELNREIAETILTMHDFEVETAVNGQETVDKFAQHEAYYYDAILMDIRMPVLDGLEATKRIRTLGKPDSRTIPIIAMTANAFDEDMKQSLDSGMNGHLSKPIEVDKLLDLLWRCITQERGKS